MTFGISKDTNTCWGNTRETDRERGQTASIKGTWEATEVGVHQRILGRTIIGSQDPSFSIFPPLLLWSSPSHVLLESCRLWNLSGGLLQPWEQGAASLKGASPVFQVDLVPLMLFQGSQRTASRVIFAFFLVEGSVLVNCSAVQLSWPTGSQRGGGKFTWLCLPPPTRGTGITDSCLSLWETKLLLYKKNPGDWG